MTPEQVQECLATDIADMAVNLQQLKAELADVWATLERWRERALKAEATLTSYTMRREARNNYTPEWD